MGQLELEILRLRIGSRALSGPMRIHVPAGQVHQLAGPNGCGKSLLLDAAVGVGPARGLKVRVDGRPVDGCSATARWQRGIRRLFQSPLVPGDITVRQALQHAAAGRSRTSKLTAKIPQVLEAAFIDSEQRLAALSFGQRRHVELCIALQARSAILLDEPFAGIAPALLPVTADAIRDAGADGCSILVVDHLQQAPSLSYVQQHEWVLPEEALHVEAHGAFPQAAIESCAIDGPAQGGVHWDVALVALGQRTLLQHCEISLGAGQFIAVSGGNGSGKSTLLRALAGAAQPWQGVRADIVVRNAAYGRHLSAQPPKLLGHMKIVDNLRVMLQTGRTSTSQQDLVRLTAARTLLAWLGLLVEAAWQRSGADLSGGEAAMVALVGAVCSSHPLLILDEPFEGLSATAMPRAQRLLAASLRAGKSAIITTHDPKLLKRMDPRSRIALERMEAVAARFSGSEPESLLTYGEAS